MFISDLDSTFYILFFFLSLALIGSASSSHVSLMTDMMRLHTVPKISFSSGKIKLPKSVQLFIEEKVKLCQPDEIHICDGSEEENQVLLSMLEKNGSVKKLSKHKNW
jgi:hypothetical protein